MEIPAKLKQIAKAVLPPIAVDAMRLSRQLIVKRSGLGGDPVIRVTLRGRSLSMNASHGLPQLMARMPYYDTALPRISAFLKKHQGHLTVIDVGANIGDTVSFIAATTPGAFLCIEGDARYIGLLEQNVRDIADVTVEQTVVSDADVVSDGSEDGEIATFVHGQGTSRLRGRPELRTTTVDALVAKYPAFMRTNLLKVDTDGYDYKVLRGSDRLLTHTRPAIYFEVSPEHLRLVGHEDPMSIFGFLAQRGYSKALFYDGSGLPLALVHTDDDDVLFTILQYARIQECFWYDVLTCHDSQKEEFQELVREETNVFPVKHWVTV